MKGLRNLGIVPLVVLAAVLMMTGVAAAQGPNPPQGTQTPPPSIIPELQGIPRDQRFDHFQGGQFTVTDAQGKAATYVMTVGTVASVTPTAVSVTPNGQTTAMSFSITPDTRVHAIPNNGSLQALTQGDKVFVLSKQGSDAAVMIAKHTTGMMGFGHGGMWQ